MEGQAGVGLHQSLGALNLECKDRLSKASTVEKCTQGMAWDLLYVLQMGKPRTFQELVTKEQHM